LRTLLDQFDGQIPAALAAYNAGANAVMRWLPGKSIDSDVWIENIPYGETRGYVQRVLWHVLTFTWLHTREAQQTKSWLNPIRAMQPTDSDPRTLPEVRRNVHFEIVPVKFSPEPRAPAAQVEALAVALRR
jgi:soluble lytic murein transglycosylase